MSKPTKIVVVGAGFAGLSLARRLEKRFKRSAVITLVDKHDYHLFLPNLYEAATAEEELVSIDQLKKSVAVPVREALEGTNIRFLKGELKGVDSRQKRIIVGHKTLEYDHLILALGDVPDFNNVKGAEDFSLPLYDLADALRIRNAVEFSVQAARQGFAKKTLCFAIAGGGGSSVELAGELSGLLDYVAWKNGYPREKLEVVILESSERLLSDFGEKAGKDATSRLKELGVRVEVGKIITEVDRHSLEFLRGEKMEYELLFWTAGTRAAPVDIQPEPKKDNKGRLKTDSNLRLTGAEDIYAIGDLGVVVDVTGNGSCAKGAQHALKQAKYLAEALPLIMQNKKPRAFAFKPSGYIINIGGKWALARVGKGYFSGFWAYALGRLVHLNYYRKVLGWKKAWKNFWLQKELYGRND